MVLFVLILILLILVLLVFILVVLVLLIFVLVLLVLILILFVLVLVLIILLLSLLLLLLSTIMSLVSIGAATAALLILVLLILRRGRGLTRGHNLSHFFINFSSTRTIRTHRRITLLFQSKRQIHSDGAFIGVGLNSTILDLLRLRNPVPRNAQLSNGLVGMIKLHMLRPRVVMRNPAGRAKISPINLP